MSSALAIDARIAKVIASQHGLARASQLRAAGVDRGAVRRRIGAASLHEVTRGLYSHQPITAATDHEVRVWATVLAMGGVSAAGLESAATRLGAWDRSDGTAWVVTTGRSPTPVPRSRRVTTRSLTPSDMCTISGLATTTWERTILDVGRTCTPHQIAWMIGRGVVLRQLDVRSLERRAARASGHAAAVCRRAIELHRSGSAGTRSASEDRLLDLAPGAITLEPIVNTKGCTGLVHVEPDFVWMPHRAIVELDGSGPHGLPVAARSDLERDRDHDGMGWRTLRVPSMAVWRNGPELVRQIERWLRDPRSVGVQDRRVSPAWRLRDQLDT